MSELPEGQSTPKDKKAITYEIPVEGSLGLLALGHVGLKLWREKKTEVHQARVAENKKNKAR